MHTKNNINQSTFYIQGLRPFKNTLPKNIKKILNKRGYAYAEILNKWNYLVGNDISKISYPKTLKIDRKNISGTLVIDIQRGSEIDVEFSKNTIIEKINSYFGYKILSNIRLETFNTLNKKKYKKKLVISAKSKEKIIKNLNSVKNEKIKKSLTDLINIIQK